MHLRKPLRSTILPAGLAAFVAAGLPGSLQAADSTLCSGEINDHLAELPLASGEVKSVRILERTNISDDYGPAIFGVDAWVRLNSCTGWLVINLTPKCYIKQTYTRGDCRVEDVPNY